MTTWTVTVAAGALVLAVATSACRPGEDDRVDVATAATELEETARAVLQDLAPNGEVTVATTRRRCADALNRDTGEEAADLTLSSMVSDPALRDVPAEELLGRAEAALRAHGFTIVEGGHDVAAGDRDGLRLGLHPVPRLGDVLASGTTGCRPTG